MIRARQSGAISHWLSTELMFFANKQYLVYDLLDFWYTLYVSWRFRYNFAYERPLIRSNFLSTFNVVNVLRGRVISCKLLTSSTAPLESVIYSHGYYPRLKNASNLRFQKSRIVIRRHPLLLKSNAMGIWLTV